MWRKITDFFKIESLTTRVRLAFLSITLLLLFSGVMSLLELERVGTDTEKILLASKSNVDLAEEMRNALDKQDRAIRDMAVMGHDINRHRTVCEESIRDLSSAISEARDVVAKSDTPDVADSLVFYANKLNALSRSYISGEINDEIAAIHEADSTSTYSAHTWYNENYYSEYFNVSRQITSYMTGVHNTLGPEVNNLSHTARRTVTPVFITLIVMIAIMLMFYFFVMVTIVKPIIRINKSLGTYLAFKTPFDDSIRSRDEVRTLRDRIAALISRFR